MIFIGLKNCDTCRKAKKWLEGEGISFEYQDVRADGLKTDDVRTWLETLGVDVLLNKRGTTWRTLDDSEKENVDLEKAADLIVKYPSLMKRPLFIKDDQLIVGFKKEQMDQLKG